MIDYIPVILFSITLQTRAVFVVKIQIEIYFTTFLTKGSCLSDFVVTKYKLGQIV